MSPAFIPSPSQSRTSFPALGAGDYEQHNPLAHLDAHLKPEFPEYEDRERKRFGNELVMRAYYYHSQLFGFRSRRERVMRYLFGDQWYELMDDPMHPGCKITEKQYIERDGRVAWVFNQLHNSANNLIGQYRSNTSDVDVYPTDRVDFDLAQMLTRKLRSAREINKADDVHADQFREFIACGLVMYSVSAKYWDQYSRTDAKLRSVNANKFYFNTRLEDIYNHEDLDFIGHYEDHSVEHVVRTFGRGEPEREAFLRDLMGRHTSHSTFAHGMHSLSGGNAMAFLDASEDFATGLDDFFGYGSNGIGPEAGQIRIYKVCNRTMRDVHSILDMDTMEVYETQLTPATVDAYNQQRTQAGQMPVMLLPAKRKLVWTTYYLLADGTILDESDSPYAHGSHAYVFDFAEWVDHRWKGLLEYMIHPQRMRNRLLGAIDFILSVGAKGLLMIPEEMLPDGVTPDMFAEKWRRFGGVITYKMKANLHPHVKPEQITTASAPASLFGLLDWVKEDMREVGGVTAANTGLSPDSGTSGIRYQAEAAYGSTNNAHYFHRFLSIVHEVDLKMAQVSVQAGLDDNQKLVFNVPGEYGRLVVFDPSRVRDVPFTTSFYDVDATPGARMIDDERALMWIQLGIITPDEYVEISGLPLMDRLKALRERNAAQGMAAGNISAMAGHAQQGGRPLPQSHSFPQNQAVVAGGNLNPYRNAALLR